MDERTDPRSQPAGEDPRRPPVVNLAAYRFVALDRLGRRREDLARSCCRLGLKGTILLSSEGINLFVAGGRQETREFLAELDRDPKLKDLDVKVSASWEIPFNRMLVKVKKEIIPCGVEGIDPSQKTAPRLSAGELKEWLDRGRPVHLLDTRNEYEIALGTFRGASSPKIDHFREFPEAIKELPKGMKREPVVIFCTGGIRCEKAGPLLTREGFSEVYQLEGGILKYFEECGGAHFEGDCFVFDRRVSVDSQLAETGTQLCFACQHTLSEEDLDSPHYRLGRHCPHCFLDGEAKRNRDRIRFEEKLRLASDPLPGSVSYDNRRPVNVPQRFAGLTLLEFLCRWHPQVPREEWEATIGAGRISGASGPLPSTRLVREGERLTHLIPSVVEPDVDPGIQLLEEDEALVVVDKPAPLPVHPCGRFNRNTLLFLLERVYSPQKLRPAHRLDANTSGVLVLCRSRSLAREVQLQFESGAVEKAYLARTQGIPSIDSFRCEEPITKAPGPGGLRTIDPRGKKAITEVRLEKRFSDGTALVRVRPVTGRTNQIRLHLWNRGFPICGDPFYLPEGKTGTSRTLAFGEPPLCLRSMAVGFDHPLTGERVVYSAPRPSWATEPGL